MSRPLPPAPNGRTHPVEYRTWRSMHERCYNTRDKTYGHYGGRGITVARAWHKPKGFRAFVHDLGPRPSVAHSLDRINVNKNYSAKNCRWALRSVQARNTRATRLVTHNGETKCLTAWATHYGVTTSTVYRRIDVWGWDAERALTTPARVRKHASAGNAAYRALDGPVQRCHNSKNPAYDRYGGRGLTVAPEWRGRGALARFKAAMGPHPGAGYSLERIDNNRGYSADNCRWATLKEQSDNRRSTRWLTHDGETKTLAEWSRTSGVSAEVISQRLQGGWPLSRALALTELQRARKICENAACSPAEPRVD